MHAVVSFPRSCVGMHTVGNSKLRYGFPRGTVGTRNFKKELQAHAPDAWIDASKKDDKDQEIGIVGYEIPFNRHFYVYQPPRDLVEIDADLDKVSGEIMALLQEVHS